MKNKTPSALGGAMIIAGTAVGAGMFSIPVVTSGVWFTGSVVLLAYTWFCMYFSGLMILEANLNYPEGAGFHTIVKDLIGTGWNTLNGLSITFVLIPSPMPMSLPEGQLLPIHYLTQHSA